MSSYAGATCRWIDWCKSYSFPPLQSNPSAVALYLTSLLDRGLSRSSILGAAYGIAWLHKKLGCPNPVDDPLVSQTLAGFKRLMAGPSRRKQPVESHHVRALIRSYGRPSASLPYLQMVSLVALGFCAFLRWLELFIYLCLIYLCLNDMVVGAVSKPQMVMLMNLWKIPLWYLEIWLFNSYDVICLINIARVLLYAAVWSFTFAPFTSDSLTLLDDTVSLPQVDMLNDF